MRIVSGEFKGRNLQSGVEGALRPTSERVREAIFSALQTHIEIENATVLDLYAGTGALGLEALSRGAAAAVFVEKNRANAEVVRANIAALGVGDKTKLIAGDALASLGSALQALRTLPSAGEVFSCVFADPPYEEHLGAEIIAKSLTSSVVSVGSIFVIEAPIKLEMPRQVGAQYDQLSAEQVKSRQYGDTEVHYYSVRQATENPSA